MFKASQALAAGVCLLTALVGRVAADENVPPGELRATLRSADEMMFDLIERGRELYNGGQHAACYHLFAGGLRALRPFLASYPDLQMEVATALEEAEKDPFDTRRAHTLRRAIDQVRKELRPVLLAKPSPPSATPGPAKAPEKKVVRTGATLWERLGKEKGARKIIDEWLSAALNDPKVNFTRDGKRKLDETQLAALKANLVDLANVISGGSGSYRGKRMFEAHQGMNITEAEFDAFVGHLTTALQNNGVGLADRSIIWAALQGKRADFVQKAAKPPVTLWDRLGGEEGAAKIVDEWLTRAMNDPKVNFARNGEYKMDDKQLKVLKESFVKLASLVSEGPHKYEGKRMVEAHKSMKITDAEYDAFVGHLVTALKNNKVKEEDIAALRTAVRTIRSNIVDQ
jgi:hemoglobin